MKILFVSNPAHGQANPLLSIAHELLARGHEVHVCSADRLIPRIRKLASAVGDHIGVTVNGKGSETSQLHFHGVGDGLSVEDLTPYAHAHPEVFHSRARHKAGDLASYVNLVCEITSPGDEEYKQTVFKVRDVVDATRAEIVVVDNFRSVRSKESDTPDAESFADLTHHAAVVLLLWTACVFQELTLSRHPQEQRVP